MAKIIQAIFVNPPIAIARLGGSTVPQEAFRWKELISCVFSVKVMRIKKCAFGSIRLGSGRDPCYWCGRSDDFPDR